MQELIGDLFDPSTYRSSDGIILHFKPDAICITTNGFVKRNGEAVMGRGCAKKAAQLIPGLPKQLGTSLKNHGLQVFTHGAWHGMEIVSFPVKHSTFPCAPDKSNVVRHMKGQFKPGQMVPGWACVANPQIIEMSAVHLRDITDELNWKHVVLPRMGAGAGELNWEKDVRPIVEPILDDRFYCITFPPRR